VNIRFEAVLETQAERVLEHLRQTAPAEWQALLECITRLEQDPYPPPSQRAPVHLLGVLLDPAAFVCGAWRISFHVEDAAFVVVRWLVQVDPRRP